MSEKADRKEFVEPELTKFEESLNEVTTGLAGPGGPACLYGTTCDI